MLSGRAEPQLGGHARYPDLVGVNYRPDWDNPGHWHRSGLWDLEPTPGGLPAAPPHQHHASALRDAQRTLQT